jgi:hypothetical protein
LAFNSLIRCDKHAERCTQTLTLPRFSQAKADELPNRAD